MYIPLRYPVAAANLGGSGRSPADDVRSSRRPRAGSSAISERTSDSPARSSVSPTSTGIIESCKLGDRVVGLLDGLDGAVQIYAWIVGVGARENSVSKLRRGSSYREANSECVRLARPYADCSGLKICILHHVGRLLVELVVRSPHARERQRKLVDRHRLDRPAVGRVLPARYRPYH